MKRITTTPRRFILLNRRHQNRAIFGNHDGMLVLRCQTAVGCFQCPAIVAGHDMFRLCRHKRLDGEDHALLKALVRPLGVETWYSWRFVQAAPDAMTRQITDDGEATAPRLILRRAPDLVQR